MITVIVGPPCAGKTTYTEAHMKPGDVRLDFDALIAAIGGPKATRHTQGMLQQITFAARESIFRNVTGALWRRGSAGVDAWMIHSAIDAQRIDAYLAAGARFLLIDPGEDECMSRARARDGDSAKDTIAAIQRWYASPPHLPEGTESMKHTTMASRRVNCKAQLLAADPDESKEDAEPGTFDALVSVFNVKDSQNAVIEPGAFTKSLEALSASGSTLPILWSHKWDDIWSHIGSAAAEQTDDGLVVHAKLDLDNPTAAQAYRLLQDGRIKEFSIGGFVPADGFDIRKDEDGNLTEYDSEFDLVEVSLCLVGANPDTQLLDVKATTGPTPAATGPSVAHLKDLRARIDTYLAELDPGADPSTPPPSGEETHKATTGTPVGGLTHSRDALALLSDVVEVFGQKEVHS